MCIEVDVRIEGDGFISWTKTGMSLINCETNLILTCVIKSIVINQTTTIELTDTKLHVPVVTDNAKLLQQLKSNFKRTTNWNKCQFNETTQVQNEYLDYLIDPSFQGVNGFLPNHI